MTMMNQYGTERILGRRTQRLWDLLQREWAGEDPHRWKQLACLHLRLHCDWSLKMIARALGHSTGHTQRLVNQGMAGLERACADVDLARVLSNETQATALLVPATASELNRRIVHCRQEMDVWERLRDERRGRRQAAPPRVKLQIVPGSLRERAAEVLEARGPKRWRTIARILQEESQTVLTTLWACPEFVCDDRGVWSLHRFRGQEQIGLDVEPIATDDQPQTGAA